MKDKALLSDAADDMLSEYGGLTIQELINGLNFATKICHNEALTAGWHDNPRDDGTFIALMHSELSEALEGLRKDCPDDHLEWRKMAEVELADALVRIFDFAGLKKLDLAGALIEKVAYNRQRADHKRENRAAEGGKKF